MNKFIVVFLSLVLNGCVAAPDKIPAAMEQGARSMQQAVKSYQFDNYVTASSMFSKALFHYQGLDAQQEVLQARFGLVQTAIAIGDSKSASKHLAKINKYLALNPDAAAQQRVDLLQGQIYLLNNQWDDALSVFDGLLPGFDANGDTNSRLSPIQMAALSDRAFIATQTKTDAMLWIARFRQQANTLKTKARLWRFQASSMDNSYEERMQLMLKALDVYKKQFNRKATGKTLQEMSIYSQEHGDVEAAIAYANRAVNVHLWILDRNNTRIDLYLLRDLYQANHNTQKLDNTRQLIELYESSDTVNWNLLKQRLNQ